MGTERDLSALSEAAARIAGKAGEAILTIYDRARPEVTLKADESPLTDADLASQGIILAELARLSPEIPVLSEEVASRPYRERRRWQRFWLVDPLDGTKEFIKRNGEFTVNIALVEGRRPVLGIVHAPALGRTYSAAGGLGAWRRDGAAEARPIRATGTGSAELLVVASRSHPSLELDGFLSALPPHRLVSVGSSLKMCLVAEGAADIYPRLGPTMEWDTGAAHAVVLEAGGTVVDRRGEPLGYNKKDLRNPHFVVTGERKVAWEDALAPER